MTLIAPPRRTNLILKAGIALAERITGHVLMPARLLAWYPKAAISSGIMEALIAHQDGRLDRRLLHLVRLTASLTARCPFCVDMNGAGWQDHGVTPEELEVMQGLRPHAETLSEAEQLAIRYARAVSDTPLSFPSDLTSRLTATFTEREIVILASTAAQVNYWARLIQALGIVPAGFSQHCPLPMAKAMKTG